MTWFAASWTGLTNVRFATKTARYWYTDSDGKLVTMEWRPVTEEDKPIPDEEGPVEEPDETEDPDLPQPKTDEVPE